MVNEMKQYLQEQIVPCDTIEEAIEVLEKKYDGWLYREQILIAASEYLNIPLEKYSFTKKYTYCCRNRDEACEMFAGDSYHFSEDVTITNITDGDPDEQKDAVIRMLQQLFRRIDEGCDSNEIHQSLSTIRNIINKANF
jgi:hypothetical protein